jgi:hypothetical protein
MKKTITLLAILFVLNAFATDRFVDPNLSQGNGTTLFTTITSAVAAAQNGDRIIVVSSTYNEAEITINKSIQIIPQIAGTTINFNANILVSGFAGMNLEIIGFNLGSYTITSNPAVPQNVNNRAQITIIDSNARIISINHDSYKLNLINCTISEDIIFRNGSVVKCSTNNLFLNDESGVGNGTNLENNKTLIAANIVTSETQLLTDNTIYKVVNNNLKHLRVQKWSFDVTKRNEISNNNFANQCEINFAILDESAQSQPSSSFSGTGLQIFAQYGISEYNFSFNNNLFIGTVSYTTFPQNASLSFLNFNGRMNSLFYGEDYYTTINNGSANFSISSTESCWPNTYSGGFFEFGYNGFLNPTLTNSQNLNYSNTSGGTSNIDGGSPNHRYYDIDLTINDRGKQGGPYSVQNYNSGANNSRAFIFDLTMPADIFPGQDVEIKAKGYHEN